LLLRRCLFTRSRVISDLKEIETFEHQTLHVFGAGLIIHLHQLLNVFDGQLVVLLCSVIVKHYKAHLNRAEDQIIGASIREAGADRGASQRVAPLELPVIVLVLVVVLELAHPWFELSWYLQVLESLVSWPVARRQDGHLEIQLVLLYNSLPAVLFICLGLLMSKGEIVEHPFEFLCKCGPA